MKSPLKTIQFGFAACLFLAVGILLYLFGSIFYATAFLALSVILSLTVCALRTPYGRENCFDRHKKGSILLMTAAILVLVASLGMELDPLPLFDPLRGADLFGYYTAQLSLTFITISVMGVLSDKSVIIYWANVSEDMLIRPTFSCFAAYTYYSIGATIGAGLGILLQNRAAFILFFILNVGILILLTISMVDVYYGRDTKKKKLEKTLFPDFNNMAAYENKILGLEQNLLTAYDQRDLFFLREIYELYVSHPEKFSVELGREAIAVMVSTLDAQTAGSFLRTLDRSLSKELSCYPMTAEELLLYDRKPKAPPCDADLWQALSADSAAAFIEEVSVTKDGALSPNGMLYAKLLMRRLALEYNRYAALYLIDRIKKGDRAEPKDYFVYASPINSVYQPTLSDGTSLPYERFNEVFDYIKTTFIHDLFLFKWILCGMDRMVSEGQNWFTAQQFSALPFLRYWQEGCAEEYDADMRPIAERVAKALEAKQDQLVTIKEVK